MHSNLWSFRRMRVNDAPIVAFNGFKVLCEAGLITMHMHKQSLNLQTWLRVRTGTDLRVWTGLSLPVSAEAAWSSVLQGWSEQGASIGVRGLRASGPPSPGPGCEPGAPGSTWAWTPWSPLAEDHYVKQFNSLHSWLWILTYSPKCPGILFQMRIFSMGFGQIIQCRAWSNPADHPWPVLKKLLILWPLSQSNRCELWRPLTVEMVLDLCMPNRSSKASSTTPPDTPLCRSNKREELSPVLVAVL